MSRTPVISIVGVFTLPAYMTGECLRSTLFAALNVLEGTVIGARQPRHRHQEFLERIERPAVKKMAGRETPLSRSLHHSTLRREHSRITCVYALARKERSENVQGRHSHPTRALPPSASPTCFRSLIRSPDPE